MSLTFDCVFVAVVREPSGLAAFTVHSPDGLRRSANKVSAFRLIVCEHRYPLRLLACEV